ncbi:putative NBD/HSP70 family sugar kinase [Motilibacter rhizosphaerae]|uniref:Putative NBD/HSP70 family sugar kinase n=1 Tax=Motilibacter rhizosphaerae TaxID=598652 RepID=A0A4Q7NUP7_9ACTN|nr:ROK family transcriptional regulator [Motilibacter rhizosphaerae]RZS90946.1 putative NBD/HSP70 family sugar kinase [Motilibacter rhizosphaerae]
MRGRESSTVRDLRRSNRARVLWELYHQGTLSRQEIAVAAGVSAGTVSNVVTELVDQGVVVEAGQEDSDGGRPRGLLQVASGYGYVIGVDIGETSIGVELFDLSMRVLAARTVTPSERRLDVDEVVRVVLDGMAAVLAESGVAQERVLGVGVGVPGLVEHGGDGVVHGPTVGWDAVPLGRLLAAGTDLPLLVENGAKTLGQAEMWFGAGRGADNAVILLLGTGVGTSIVLGGALYRGAGSSAGEWGHTTVVTGGRLCRCGATGCLEAYVGAGALLRRYEELTGTSGSGSLEERTADLLASDDAAARQVRAETAEYLGAGVGSLVNLFNPERIVVGGWVGRLLGEAFLPVLREQVASHALALPFSQTSLVLAELGRDAIALGAATQPVERLLTSGAMPQQPPRSARRPSDAVGRR